MGSDREGSNAEVEAYSPVHNAYGFAAVNPSCDDISAKHLKSFKKNERMVGLVLYCAEENVHPATAGIAAL